MVNGIIKITFGMFLITKSSQHATLLASLTALLSLSKNTVYIDFPHSQKLIMCWIGLPLPFHNIKCTGNHPFSKVKWVVFILSKPLSVPITLSSTGKSNTDISCTYFARTLCHLQLDFSIIFLQIGFSAGSCLTVSG